MLTNCVFQWISSISSRMIFMLVLANNRSCFLNKASINDCFDAAKVKKVLRAGNTFGEKCWLRATHLSKSIQNTPHLDENVLQIQHKSISLRCTK